MRAKLSQLVVSLVVLASITSAHAQGTNQYGRTGGYTQPGGYYYYGPGAPVVTGRGPLTQPIPPAVSSINRGQNVQQGPYGSQNYWGPALTNPPQYPFGAR
jgi:hypothetical protein